LTSSTVLVSNYHAILLSLNLAVEVGERKLALEIARTKAESDERRQATIDKRKASKTAAIAVKKEKAKAAAAEAGETAVPAEGQVEIAEGETKPKKKRKSSRVGLHGLMTKRL
jgi:hypothetical protein